MSIGLIWAQAHGGVIGNDGGMPWHIPEDLAHFKATTLGSPVVMGRRTWESFPARFRPLPGRRNIVITRQPDFDADGAEVVHSLEDALALVTAEPLTWVIGGAQVYRASLPLAERLEVTEIDADFDGDAFAPEIDETWTLESRSPWQTSSGGPRYRFLRYARPAS